MDCQLRVETVQLVGIAQDPHTRQCLLGVTAQLLIHPCVPARLLTIQAENAGLVPTVHQVPITQYNVMADGTVVSMV